MPSSERDVPAQTRAYLRVLYSARLGRHLERAVRRERPLSPELEFARSLDFAQLASEQQARVRNLSHSLRRSCQFLAEVTSQDEFRALVAAYADHTSFWRVQGRSLGENFCLFAYKLLRDRGQRWNAEVARLDGVTFGVAAQPADETPWRSYLGLRHDLQRHPGSIAERYHAPLCVLDASGGLAAQGNVDGQGAEPSHPGFWVRISSNGLQLQTEVVPC